VLYFLKKGKLVWHSKLKTSSVIFLKENSLYNSPKRKQPVLYSKKKTAIIVLKKKTAKVESQKKYSQCCISLQR